ncbi:UNVERIFIED_CONTAM: putative mitochondrial protein [Sesamum radiatum]|uniref:Mitochondrial protein n=1 Tax=Sesamum radiatum TaxID=300843 RepID=A0AAW2M1U5_SESRA
MPTGIWHSDPENGGFHVVGCVLSHKPYHVAALKTVLKSSLNPAKGMDISFIEGDRFLLKFFHSVDRDQVLASGPWAFEKNLVVLAPMSDIDNPAEVDLAWCDFHVRIHGLPLGKMTPEIASFIGGKIGRLKDFDLSKGPESGDHSCVSVLLLITVNPTPIRRRFDPFSPRQSGPSSLYTETRRGTAIFGDFPPVTASPGSSVTRPNPAHSPATSTEIELSSSVQVTFSSPTPFNPAPPIFPQSPPAPSPHTDKVLSAPSLFPSMPTPPFSSTLSSNSVIPLPAPPAPLSQSLVCPASPLPKSVQSTPSQSQITMIPPKRKYTKKTRPTTESNLCPQPTLPNKRLAAIFRGLRGAGYTEKSSFLGAPSSVTLSVISAWLCAGDFNEILAHSEKEGGPPRAEWQIHNFRECLSDCDWHDLGFRGPDFTWVVKWTLSGNRRCFRFEAAWLQEPACEGIISKAWSPPGFSLSEKIASVSAKLSGWGRALGRETRDRIQELERSVLTQKHGVVTADTQSRGLRDKAELTKLILQEEIFWKQRKSAEEVQRCILEYFQGVFTSSNPLPDDIRSGTEHLPTVVDEQWRRTCNGPTQNLRIISPAQSAFVPGRLITDNVLLAFETNHFLNTHSKGSKHFMNLKLDISKAYDRVEWPFLRRVLGKLGFPCVVVDLIMLCVTTVSYSFVLSGHQFGSIIPQRGLRQGDPSLLSVSLCTESLSALFRMAAERGTILGVAVCRGAPRISHLLFADDTMVFCPANVSTIQHVRQAGKAVLIQAVVQAIPSYAMSCFRLPKTLLVEFQSLAANFFWHDGDKRRIHWLAWDHMCRSKLDGGLGFRNLEAFNLALLAKQLWRLLSRPDSLVSKVLKAKYFPRAHLFEARLGARPSYTLRSIWAAMDLFKAGCRWRIGTGHAVRIWQDPWIPRTPSFRIITPKPSSCPWTYVSDLVLASTREWNEDTISAFVWPEDRDYILQIPLSFSNVPDLLIWHYSPNGIFSIRSAYHLALSLGSPANSSTGRNLKLVNKDFHPPLQVVDFARHYLRAYQSQNTQGLNAKSVQQSYWHLPPAGWIKVNFDGGFRDRGREMGLGAIAFDASGSCLAWLSIRMHRGGTAELAEAFAAREAIRLARRHQWRRVILEGDCSTLLHKLSNALPDFSVASTVIEDVRSVSSLVESLSFSLVLRCANSAADFLAKSALNQVGDSSCFTPGLDALILGDLAN